MSAEILPLAPVADAPVLIDLEPVDVHGMLNRGEAILVDVREASEYENVRIPGAFLMPLSFFEGEHFPTINETLVVLMCAVGKRSAAAAKQMMNAGFGDVHHMKGGINAWMDQDLPVDQD
ncbi:MAG: rhodanese-like domain-containing protein [Rhodospirillaceae bacterium]|nr:rhodanese-like domain-containing protein [Rhodospirillaceae bacterium]